jgi:HEAT repeat protein
LFALADTLEPTAVAELRRRLSDDSDTVRFTAACLLTEFQDASGLAELKKALERMRSQHPVAAGDSFAVERLLASLERITGKSFGELPRLNPFLDSDSRRAQQSTQRYRELLDAWAAWWAWEPADRRNARQP